VTRRSKPSGSSARIRFPSSRAYAQWCGALFEKLHDAFINYWRKAGVEVETPRRPLVIVIFSDRERYEAHAARDLGAAADRVVGYYNLLTNRVTTFDLTGSDQLARRPATSAGRAGLEILASPEAAGLVSTLVHEASHQMAFNCRMHRRLAPVPVWLSEGVATFFETPDPGGRGWKRIGGVNRPRLDTFLTSYRPGVLDEIVRGDEPFRATEGAIDAYARAWALTAFLAQTRKAALVDYITAIGAKPPLAPDGPEERLQDFVAAFGVEPHELEQPPAADRLLGQPGDDGHAGIRALHPIDVRFLGRGPGDEERIGGVSSCQRRVNDPGPRLDAGAAEIGLERLGLEDGCRLGQSHDHHLRLSRILEAHHRRDDMEVGIHVPNDVAVIGPCGVDEEQRVPRRGGVDDDERLPRFLDHARKRLKDGDLFGAGGAKILREERPAGVVEASSLCLHDVMTVAFPFIVGIDPADGERGDV